MKYTNTHDNQSVTVTGKDGKVVRLAPGESVEISADSRLAKSMGSEQSKTTKKKTAAVAAENKE